MILHLRKSRWKKCTTQRFSFLRAQRPKTVNSSVLRFRTEAPNARCLGDQVLFDLDLRHPAVVSVLHPSRPLESMQRLI